MDNEYFVDRIMVVVGGGVWILCGSGSYISQIGGRILC